LLVLFVAVAVDTVVAAAAGARLNDCPWAQSHRLHIEKVLPITMARLHRNFAETMGAACACFPRLLS
jgi:hypothetical protein